MSDEHVMPMLVAVLGTDAIAAAGPAEPVQLWRACQTIGFDFVVPVTWGEELISSAVASWTADQDVPCAVVASCPLVEDRLASTTLTMPVMRTVPPPVACARYVRAALKPRRVHVTYVGACPGAASDEVDGHLLPEMLLTRFIEAGVDLLLQPRHFDGQVPPDRARYASSPGGAPNAVWLARQGIRLIEAAPITVDAVCQTYATERVLIDLAASCRCVCAGDRSAATRLEPPAAFLPVVMNLGVPVSETGISAAPDPDAASPAAFVNPSPPRARFAENGLSAGEAVPMPEPVTAQDLLSAIEPW